VALVVAAVAVQIARESGVVGISALGSVAAIALAALAFFAVCGFGATRLLLPEGLRRYELAWAIPVGACTSALGLTLLGFAFVPMAISIAVLAVAGIALGVFAVRRSGPPARPPRWRELAWPAFVAIVLACIALVPLFRAGYATVAGDGSDAHLAVGAAQFLQHDYPTAVNVNEPVDQFPLVWKSKYPIYYDLGAVAMLAGRQTYATISTLAAIMLALAAVGWFLFARELLGARMLGALAAMGIVGLNQMVLHTGMHPYFNQTWGYFTLPFSLVLAWSAVRYRSAGALALLAMFLAVAAFAYPLELPIPVAALVVFAVLDADLRAGAGAIARRVWTRRRALILAVPVVLLLAIPAYGVGQKLISGAVVVLVPGHSLGTWGGDLLAFIPTYEFFSLGQAGLWPWAVVAMVGFALYALRDRPRAFAVGIVTVLAVSALAAVDFRLRTYGWYFEFKILAFVAPLLIVCAAVGISRLRWPVLAWVLLGLFALTASQGALNETSTTYDQTPKDLLQLQAWSHALPRSESVRFDITPGAQLWAQYMFAGHPTCSELPLLGTSYPHVTFSLKADYALVQVAAAGSPEPHINPPYGAVGGPVFENASYALYRLGPSVPGTDTCTRRTVQTVLSVALS
jgi:hypothetical protein